MKHEKSHLEHSLNDFFYVLRLLINKIMPIFAPDEKEQIHSMVIGCG